MKKKIIICFIIVGCLSPTDISYEDIIEQYIIILKKFESTKSNDYDKTLLTAFFSDLVTNITDYENATSSLKIEDKQTDSLIKRQSRITKLWHFIITMVLEKNQVQRPLKYLYIINRKTDKLYTDYNLDKNRYKAYENSLPDFWIKYSLKLLTQEGDNQDPNNFFERYIIHLLQDETIEAETALGTAREKAELNKAFVYNQDIIDLYINLPMEFFDIYILIELLGLSDNKNPEQVARIINEYTADEQEAKQIMEDCLKQGNSDLAKTLLEISLADNLIDKEYYNKMRTQLEQLAAQDGKELEFKDLDEIGKAYSIRVNGKWGFIDKSGSIALKPEIEASSVGEYKEGRIIFMTHPHYEIIELNRGEILIPARSLGYEIVNTYNDGLAGVKKNGKWGFINREGELISGLKYDEIKDFSEDLAAVKIDNRWGFINTTGEILIDTLYDEVGYFSRGLAFVKLNNKYGYIDNKGNPIGDIKFEDHGVFHQGLAFVKYNGLYGYINKQGKLQIEAKYNACQYFQEDLAAVKIDNKWGFINMQGEVVIQAQYDFCGIFSQDLARVMINNRYGYIDKTGNLIIKSKYDYAYDFANDLAKVEIDDKYGFIDKEGQIIIDIVYDHCGYLSDDMVSVEIDGKYGFLDKEGFIALDMIYNDCYSFNDGIVAIKLEDKWGVANKQGAFILQPIYDYCYTVKGFIMVNLNAKYGIMKPDGQWIIKPEIYDSINISDEGLAVARLPGEYGLLNKQGEVILTPQYHNIYNFSDKFYSVKKDGKWGLLDKTSLTEVLTPTYDSIYSYSNGSGYIEKNDKYGFIDETGNIIVEPRFDYPEYFSDQVVKIKENDRWGLYNHKTGTIVTEPIYLTLNGLYDGLAAFEKQTKYRILHHERTSSIDYDVDTGHDTTIWGFLDENGDIAIKPRYGKAYNFSEDLCFVYYLAGIDEDDKLLYMSMFINKEGQPAYWSVPDYDTIWVEYKNGVVKFKKDEKFGLIDKNGEIIHKPELDSIYDFTKDFSYTKYELDNRYGLINNQGKITVQALYDDIKTISESLSMAKKAGRYFFIQNQSGERINDVVLENYWINQSGFHRVLIDGQYGFINSLGKIVIEPQYKEVTDFYEGLAAVKIDNKWGFIDLTGYLIIEPQFDSVQSFNDGISKVTIGNKFGYINNLGEIIWEPTI